MPSTVKIIYQHQKRKQRFGLGVGFDVGLGTGAEITGAIIGIGVVDTPSAAPVRVPVCCMMFAVLPLTNVYAVKSFVVF